MTDTTDIDAHQAAISKAFKEVIWAEQAVADHEQRLRDELAAVTNEHKSHIAEHQAMLAAAWARIAELMAETGETEVTLPGTATDYRIGWSTPGVSAVVDAEACPDDWVKVERKPMLAQIKAHYLDVWKAGLPIPNWITFSHGERKLGWRAVKRGAKA